MLYHLFDYLQNTYNMPSALLVQKSYNSAGVLISRLDGDYWGRSDTTTYIRNKENNRIESVTIHKYTTDYRHPVGEEPYYKVIVDEFEKHKFIYQ